MKRLSIAKIIADFIVSNELTINYSNIVKETDIALKHIGLSSDWNKVGSGEMYACGGDPEDEVIFVPGGDPEMGYYIFSRENGKFLRYEEPLSF